MTDNKTETKTEIKKTNTQPFSYYYNQPEYRAKHLAKVKEKIECPACGVSLSRSNMGHHKTTKKHQQNQAEYDKEQKKQEQEEKVKTLQKMLDAALLEIKNLKA